MKCQVMKMAGRRDILMMSMGIRKLSGKKTGWRFQYERKSEGQRPCDRIRIIQWASAERTGNGTWPTIWESKKKQYTANQRAEKL